MAGKCGQNHFWAFSGKFLVSKLNFPSDFGSKVEFWRKFSSKIKFANKFGSKTPWNLLQKALKWLGSVFGGLIAEDQSCGHSLGSNTSPQKRWTIVLTTFWLRWVKILAENHEKFILQWLLRVGDWISRHKVIPRQQYLALRPHENAAKSFFRILEANLVHKLCLKWRENDFAAFSWGCSGKFCCRGITLSLENEPTTPGNCCRIVSSDFQQNFQQKRIGIKLWSSSAEV